MKKRVEERGMLDLGEEAVPEGARGERGGGGFVEPERLAVEADEAQGRGKAKKEEKEEAVTGAGRAHGGKGYAKTGEERTGWRGNRLFVEGPGGTVVKSRSPLKEKGAQMYLNKTIMVAALALLVALAVVVPGAMADKKPRSLGDQVRRELIMLPYYSVFDWLGYELKGNQVTLEGQVTRPSLRSDAEAVVKDLEGVGSVVNNIEVLPNSPNDDRIRRAVYRTLYAENSPLFRYGVGAVDSIHIIVKNGNVTLVGTVNTEMDKNIAGIRANGVTGVFSVTNNLTVGS